MLKLLRLGVPLLIVGSVAIALAWISWNGDIDRQWTFLYSAVTLACGIIATLLWVLLLSGLPWQIRAGVVGGALLLGGLAFATLRVRGVTGDLVPVLEWRFAPAGSGIEVESPAPGGPPSGAAAAAGGEARGAGSPGAVADYAGYRGPGRGAVLPGVRLDRARLAEAPRLLWRRPVGGGWSAFAVSGAQAITQEQREGEELVTCYDVRTGAPLWTRAYAARFDTAIGGIGPRATPEIAGDRVLAQGATGLLHCLARADGAVLWQKDIFEGTGREGPEWGVSISPLVHEGLVIVSTGAREGRSLVAYRLEDGSIAWTGGDARMGYSSPFLATLGGELQVVLLNDGSVTGHDPASGAVLWEAPWPRGKPCAAQPLSVGEDSLIVSSGYGVGVGRFRIRKAAVGAWEAAEEWHTLSLKAKFSSFVERGGLVFGLDEGILVCLDPSDGSRRWKGGRYGHGQLILAGDILIVGAENGEVAFVEAVPDAFRELGRFRAVEDKMWNCPALAAPLLLVRNDLEAACFELPVMPPAQSTK